jgi:biopolymer transport protein ExbD
MSAQLSATEVQRRVVLFTLLLTGVVTSSCTRDNTPLPVTLVIKPTGTYELNGSEVKPESLEQALRAAAPASAPLHLIIKADPAATHQSVVTAMQAAQSIPARISFASGSSP